VSARATKAVLLRARDRCEVCERLHMVLTVRQVAGAKGTARTCLAICADCVRQLGRGELPVLRRVLAVTSGLGMTEAAKATEKRIAHVEVGP
jgi:hypothetical protein